MPARSFWTWARLTPSTGTPVAVRPAARAEPPRPCCQAGLRCLRLRGLELPLAVPLVEPRSEARKALLDGDRAHVEEGPFDSAQGGGLSGIEVLRIDVSPDLVQKGLAGIRAQ